MIIDGNFDKKDLQLSLEIYERASQAGYIIYKITKSNYSGRFEFQLNKIVLEEKNEVEEVETNRLENSEDLD